MRTKDASIYQGRLAGTTQVERTCKAVLRTIWAQGLRSGERLPNHRVLIASLGVSNNTMDAAMRRLVEIGVISRRPKLGTIVEDPNAYTEPLWRVGVLENFTDMRTASPYWSLLGAFVQHDLANAGCWPRLYFHRSPSATPFRNVSDFRSLQEDVDRGRLDGAISLGSMDLNQWDTIAAGLPICGFHETMRAGVVVDTKGWREHAHDFFTTRGYKRIAEFKNGDAEGLFPIHLHSNERMRVSFPRPSGSPRAIYHMEAGRVAGRALLDRSPATRPDALIVPDDYLCAGLTLELRQSKNYRPPVAVLTHLQNPLPYALHTIRYEVDISEMSQLNVSLMLEYLRNPALPCKIERITPCFTTEAPALTVLPG